MLAYMDRRGDDFYAAAEKLLSQLWPKGLPKRRARKAIRKGRTRGEKRDRCANLNEAAEASPETRLSLVDWSLVHVPKEEQSQVFTFDENIMATNILVIPRNPFLVRFSGASRASF